MAAAASEVQIDEVRLEGGFLRLEGNFFKASFAGLDLIIVEQKGWINASHLCQLKGKTLDLYRQSRAQELELESTRFYDLNPLLDGTYVRPCQLLDVAAWLAPQTYIGAAVIIDAFYQKRDAQAFQFYWFYYPDLKVDEKSVTPYTIQLLNFNFVADKRGWFVVTDAVCEPGKTVNQFEKKPDSVFLLKYFRIARSSSTRTHYHPLLFLRLVAWANPTFYQNFFILIFNCRDPSLKALFRQAIAAVGASLNSIPAESLDKLTDVSAKGRNKAEEALTREQLEKLEKEANELRGELKRLRLANAVLEPFKKKYDEAEKQLQELRRQLVLGEQISKLQNTLDNLGIFEQ